MSMIPRRLPLIAAMFAALAAAPPPYPPITLGAQALDDHGKALGSLYTPAPVPNENVERPGHGGQRAHTELTPGLYRPGKSYLGDGYTPGSTIQGEEQRRYKPLPNLSLSVPLD